MPWWMPDFDSGMIGALLFFGMAIGGIWFHAMLPTWKAQSNAKARKIEKDAELAETLKVTSQQQTDLMGRTVAQLHDHGIKLDSHGVALNHISGRLEEHGELIKEINRQRTRDCRIEGPQREPGTETIIAKPSGLGHIG